MKCPSCAGNYDDNFKYCPYCGTSKPQPPTVRVQVNEPKYEYCDIEEEVVRPEGWFTKRIVKVVARGTGRNGDIVYSESESYGEFDSDRNGELKGTRLWNAIRRQLLEEGWDEVPENPGKLRRLVA